MYHYTHKKNIYIDTKTNGFPKVQPDLHKHNLLFVGVQFLNIGCFLKQRGFVWLPRYIPSIGPPHHGPSFLVPTQGTIANPIRNGIHPTSCFSIHLPPSKRIHGFLFLWYFHGRNGMAPMAYVSLGHPLIQVFFEGILMNPIKTSKACNNKKTQAISISS